MATKDVDPTRRCAKSVLMATVALAVEMMVIVAAIVLSASTPSVSTVTP